jgi:hypothetical protein
MRGLFLAGLVVSFGSIIAGAFTVNFYLGQQHNIVEPGKIIRFRTAEEIEWGTTAYIRYMNDV